MGTVTRSYGPVTASPVATGQSILAAHVNTDLDTLYSLVNGNIDNDNIKSSAGIVYSKLNLAGGLQYSDILSTSFHKASVTRSSTQLIGNATGTALSFSASDYESDTSMWDIGDPTKIVCKKAGKYMITGFGSFASNATGYRQFSIKVNGTTLRYITVPAVNGDETGLTIALPATLAVNDYVQIFVYQTSTGNLNVTAGSYLDVSLLP